MNTIPGTTRACTYHFFYLHDGSQQLVNSTRFESDVQVYIQHGNMTRQINMVVDQLKYGEWACPLASDPGTSTLPSTFSLLGQRLSLVEL